MRRRSETAPFLIYATRTCPFCHAAKRLLAGAGEAFEEVDVTGDGAAREELERETGQRTVPQVFHRGAHIGGYDELAAWYRTGGPRPEDDAS